MYLSLVATNSQYCTPNIEWQSAIILEDPQLRMMYSRHQIVGEVLRFFFEARVPDSEELQGFGLEDSDRWECATFGL